MHTLTGILKAMADPSRLKILKAIEERPLCVCEIQELLGLAQPTISKHLKILYEAGLVQSHRHKNWIQYHLMDESGCHYVQTLLADLRGWLNDDLEIIGLKKRLDSISCMTVHTRQGTGNQTITTL